MNVITSRVRQSQIIDLVYYNKDNQTLGIHFKKSDVTWIYFNVPPSIFGELLSSSSVGSFFMKKIRNNYEGKKLEKSFYVETKAYKSTKQAT